MDGFGLEPRCGNAGEGGRRSSCWKWNELSQDKRAPRDRKAIDKKTQKARQRLWQQGEVVRLQLQLRWQWLLRRRLRVWNLNPADWSQGRRT